MPIRIQRSTALPIDLFADQAIFEVEVADIWHRDWIFATTVDAVADPGDFVPVMIGRQPVIIVRGDDYQLRALANVCSHRGAPLVDCAGRAPRFSCPYHGWTYDVDGRLLSVPYAAANEVPKADLGLESFRVEHWHGLVFVSLDPDVEAITQRVDAIEHYVRPLAIDRLHHDVAGVTTDQWRANWKIVYSNAVDSYSHFRVHSETVEPFSPTDASYYLAGSARATVTGGEAGERADHLVIALPPSFVAIIFPDALLWQALIPMGVSTTQVTIGIATETANGTGSSAASAVEIGTSDSGAVHDDAGWEPGFIGEDRTICERVQQSAKSRWNAGPLLEIERALGDFHQYLAWRLAGREPDPVVVAAQPGDRPEPQVG